MQAILRDLGHHYTMNGIAQSEIRVLKTLDYRISLATPLVYVDTLLRAVGMVPTFSLCSLYALSCILIHSFNWQSNYFRTLQNYKLSIQ